MNRVVVTGIGAVTPIGNDAQTTWKGMKCGKNGIGFITRFDTERIIRLRWRRRSRISIPALYLEKNEVRKTDLYTQYALAAAAQAVEDSGIVGNCGAGTAGSLCRLWNRRHDHLCGRLQKAV